jgi:sugar phosphate isomerase/epimerase
MTAMDMTRRQFIAGALAFTATGPQSIAAAIPFKRRRMRLGVQMHGIRDCFARDFDGTLAAIRAIGCEGLEAGRFFGLDATEFGKRVRGAGLELVAIQLYPHYLTEPKKLYETIKFCQESGCSRFNMAWFKGSAENPNDWQLIVDILNHAAEVCEKEGLTIGYHNHDQEFRIRFGEKTAMEWLVEHLSPKVALEFDPGWCVAAGADPFAWIAKHPRRNPCVHLMPSPPDKVASIGAPNDMVDWRRLVPALEEDGCEWAFVKPLVHPDSLDDLKSSCKWLEANI